MKKIFINENNQLRSGWKITLALILPFFILFSVGIGVGIICSIAKVTIDPQQINSLKEGVNGIIIRIAVIIFQEIIPILVCVVLWKALDKKSLKDFGMTSLKKDWKSFIVGLIIGAISLTMVAIILLLTKYSVVNGSLLKPNFSPSIISSFIIYIFVGFSEEILCRGYFLSVLKQCKNKYVPYIGSSILFALMHSLNSGISIPAYINLFLFGLFLAYIVYKTGNLWVGIGIHITWNFFEGSVFGFLVSGGNISESVYYLQNSGNQIINGGTFGPEGGLVVTFVLILSIFLTYKFCPKSNRIEN